MEADGDALEVCGEGDVLSVRPAGLKVLSGDSVVSEEWKVKAFVPRVSVSVCRAMVRERF